MSKVFQQKLGTKINSSKTGDPLKINFLSLASLLWLRPCLSQKKKKNYITKCDAKVMTHLNFDRNNGKPAAVTSWGLGDVGASWGMGGGGEHEPWGGQFPPSTPKMTPQPPPQKIQMVTLERLNQSEPNFHTWLLTGIAHLSSKMGIAGQM